MEAKAELNRAGGMGLAHAESSQLLYTCSGEKSGQLLLSLFSPDFNRDLVKRAWTGQLNNERESEEWKLGKEGRKGGGE